MCGIVGAVAERNITAILLEGLKRLEYRGYDSAGVAVLDGSAYGCPGYIRMSFATGLETIRKGCEKISVACAQLQ